jgi:NAD(P)H dehydrogenase (quinone)
VANIAVIYYSTYGNTYRLAQAIEEDAQSAGAKTRLRRVRELAPDAAIDTQPRWREHLQATLGW